jgi:hypothetical protein
MEHVQIRALEHMTGDPSGPRLRFAVETRDRPGPAYKAGVFSDDEVWIQLSGGLLVARARVKIAWKGEYSRIEEITRRVKGAPLPASFWQGRPRSGYAVVAELENERWIDPYWGGPRSYAYEWITLEGDAKRAGWLDRKEPPRGGEDLRTGFRRARDAGFVANMKDATKE